VSYFKALLIAIATLLFSVTVMISMLVFGKSVFHIFARLWSKVLLFFAGIKVDATYSGMYESSLQVEESKFVFVANHSSFFDIPVILATCGKKANIVYKKSLEEVPVWGWGLKMSPFVGVDRSNSRDSMDAIGKAIDLIRKGDSVIIFPEGTRTESGELGPFKRGAFMMAARSDLPIVPVAIKGTYGKLSFKPFQIKGGRVNINYGVPYDISGQGAMVEKAAMTHVRELIAQLLENM